MLENFEEKIEKIAHATKDVNVTSISGVPTWNLVLFKRILEITGKNNLLEVWPNLEMYFHGAVNFTPYREQFKKLIPNEEMYYLENYNASEGFFGIQDTKEPGDMLLMLDYGIFYEFLPLENLHDENPETLTLDEVELNKNYALIISTNAGLWRYMIGDTIKFSSLSPFRIQITGRTKHFINAFGEEVIIDNAERALEEACMQTGAIIREYTAAPVYFNGDECGAHEWIIEFEKKPADPCWIYGSPPIPVTWFFTTEKLKELVQFSFLLMFTVFTMRSTPVFFMLPIFVKVVAKPVVVGTGSSSRRSLVSLVNQSMLAVMRSFKIPMSTPASNWSVVSHLRSGLAKTLGAWPIAVAGIVPRT
jgi:hypothetical protein